MILLCRGGAPVPARSRQPHGAEVVVADFEAVEGVAVVAAVLFDDVPARAGFASRFKDGGPVEVAFADFGKARFPAFNGHVFDVDEVYAGVGFADPFGGVASSCLHPVHVDFELYCFGVCFLQDDFKGGAVAEFLKFKVVVVICKGQARVGEFATDFGGVFGKADISVFSVFPIRWGQASDGGVFAVPEAVFVYDGLCVVAHAVKTGVCGADFNVVVIGYLFEFCGVNGTKAGDLHGVVTNGFYFFYGFDDV